MSERERMESLNKLNASTYRPVTVRTIDDKRFVTIGAAPLRTNRLNTTPHMELTDRADGIFFFQMISISNNIYRS